MYEIFEKLLKERGIKTADVVRATGLSSTFFSEWKKGKSKSPKPENLQKIADYFGVTVDYLMTGKDSQVDYLYSDENVDLLIEVTNKIKNDADFVRRMKCYMSLLNENKKSVDDMIDLMYLKEQKGED